MGADPVKFDFSRPYGEVFGGNAGHRYEQDGALFDYKAELISTAPVAKRPYNKKPKPDPTSLDGELASQLQDFPE